MSGDHRAARGLVDELATTVIGRRRELELVLAALVADRHVLLEGPPGVGKSTLLRAVSRGLGVGFVLCEGNAELTPSRLVGHFDPARVLAEGYHADIFVDGPLVTALRCGSLLYVEELNRVPDETLNVLVTVMSEGTLTVPRLGTVGAAPGFGLVAAMNPFDAVGTARISQALRDRMCRLSLGYQDHATEVDVVVAQTDERTDSPTARSWLARVVEVVRATRDHPDTRSGASVRGAIDLVLVARSLARLREQPETGPALGLDAALLTLSGRVEVDEGSGRTAEDVVAELWHRVFDRPEDDQETGPAEDGESAGKAAGPADLPRA